MSDNMVSQLQGIIQQINGQRKCLDRTTKPVVFAKSDQEIVHLFVESGHPDGNHHFVPPGKAQVLLVYQDSHRCGVCQQQFIDVVSFLKHKLEHAFGQQMYRCELCTNVVHSKVELISHYRLHHNLLGDGLRSFEPLTTKPPEDKQSEANMENIADVSHEAKICSPIIQDVRLSDGGSISSDTAIESSEYPGAKPNPCRSKMTTLRHRSITGSSKGKGRAAEAKHLRHPPAVVSVYPCPVCGKVFRCRRYLRKHSETHGAGHSCDICGKSYRSRAYLKLHRRRHEKLANATAAPAEPAPVPQRPRFSCAECDFTSDVIAAIHAHLQVHASSGSVRCAICGRAYSNRAALSKHRRVHDADRPFACPVAGCRWRFRTDVMCRAHVLAHTVAGRFRCSTCGYVFRRKHHLQRHEARMHQSNTAITTGPCATPAPIKSSNDGQNALTYQHNTDVLLSPEIDSMCPSADIYSTGSLMSDEDSLYSLMVNSDEMCEKKSGSFIVDDLGDLFQ